MKRLFDRGLITAALLSVVWFFHWTVDSGLGFTNWGDFDYYQLLVRGFKKGHLYLDKEPSPELVALADPYDPAQNGPHRLPDASYFKGKYYLYFGPTPAVTLMWPYAALTGAEMPTGAAIFIFCSIGFLAGSAVWLAMRRRYFPESATWVAVLGVFAFGFGTHVLSLPQRPMWWELAIAGGFAFSMLALLAVYFAIHGSRPAFAMACAGLCVGLAGASRPPCFFGAAMLLPPLWLAWRQHGFGRAWWRIALAGGIALSLCVGAVLAYNHARFGNALEFGQNYQLSGAHEGKLTHFSPRFILHNLTAYFFNPVTWTWEFPFLSARQLTSTIPGYFGAEEVAGLAVTCVFVWFVIALPLVWRKRQPGEIPPLNAMIAAVGAVALCVGAFICTMFSNTARYSVDFMPAVGLLALCGVLGLERWLRDRTTVVRSIAFPVIASAFVVTLVMGALISLDYHSRSFSRTNATRWVPMERRAYEALSWIGVWIGALPGGRELKVRFETRPVGTVETFWRARDPAADEQILLEHVGPREIRFGYRRGTGPVKWGDPETWAPNHTHTVLLQLPSMYGAANGWMSGLRRGVGYRERSSVGLTFSGGRVLGEIVPPLPEDIEIGGFVPEEFSGKIRQIRVRPFDGQAFVGRAEPRIETAESAKPGGTVRMSVVFPQKLAAEGEPLLAAGALFGSDIVFARETSDGAMKLVFEHFGQPHHESPPLRLDRTREHVVEIGFPSLNVETFGTARDGDILVRINGEDAIRARGAGYYFPPDHPALGRNPFATTCAREFRGWILGARWVE